MRPREPGKPCQNVGGKATHRLAGFPGLPGPPRPTKYGISGFVFWSPPSGTPFFWRMIIMRLSGNSAQAHSMFEDKRLIPMQSQGFKKPHGLALEFVYRHENRCKSSGAPAGAFSRPLRGRVEPGTYSTSTISDPHPPEQT